MDGTSEAARDGAAISRPAEVAIQIGLLILLVAWCFQVVRPFIVPIMWAAIIATAVFPAHEMLAARLGGRQKLAATIFTLLALVLMLTPTVMLAGNLFDAARALLSHLQDGSLKVPPVPEGVATWPIIGERLHDLWALASQNLGAVLTRFEPQLIALSTWLVSAAATAGLGILQFAASVAIAGVLLVNAEESGEAIRGIALRVAGQRGREFTDAAAATVRSVAQGVLGVAVIQSLLAGAALLVIGVPGAGFWALLVLLTAVVQLPPLLILAPIAAWVFYSAGTTTGVLFLGWSVFVSVSDTFLKPLLLGRGVDVPVLVILLGAIGGMLAWGIIGLFVGSVVLGLGYELFRVWLRGE